MPALPHVRTLTGLLAIALALAALFACSDIPESSSGTGIHIPEQWQTTRQVDGHQVHVVDRKIACAKCHELTDSDIGRVVPGKCASCHEKQAMIKHDAAHATERFGPGADADCTTCHAFTVDPAHAKVNADAIDSFSPRDCGRCHLERQGQLSPVRVHHTEPCLSCHQPHAQELPTPAPCDQCHQNIASKHGAADNTVIENCTECHASQHAPASEARSSCAACHAKNEPRVPESALFAEGHAECVGCHQPHDFAKKSVVGCDSCHAGMHVLGGRRIPQHNECTNCHSPHDVKSASARACATCHKSVSPNHPKHGKAGTCTGCHDPHPASPGAHDKVRACTSCHQEARNETDRHGGVSCRECHQPHNFLLASQGQSLCARCHSEPTTRVATLKGHAVCASCHQGLPHRPEALLAGCPSCHQAEQAEVRRGHSECRSCHEPHAGTLQKECKSCHRDEHQSAPLGHQNCTGCHQPHTGSTRANACGSCHGEQAQLPHGKLKANCADCHRPHGPAGPQKPPTCTTCHTQASLRGLHDNPKHKNCLGCHDPHGAKLSVRAPCVECHKDKAQHFPEAPNCASCHLFVETR